MQFFKISDENEQKMFNSAHPIISQIDLQKDLFSAGAYESWGLADVIYADKRAPLTNAIRQEIFRDAFSEIFNSFAFAGTGESYISIFKKIFGDTVVIEFEVPDPGKLNISIEASGFELYDFVARYIEDNEYLFDEVVDEEDDNIAFQVVKGFETQYEVEQMLFEFVPNGIFTQISLTFT